MFARTLVRGDSDSSDTLDRNRLLSFVEQRFFYIFFIIIIKDFVSDYNQILESRLKIFFERFYF